jgi:hypothetical protein
VYIGEVRISLVGRVMSVKVGFGDFKEESSFLLCCDEDLKYASLSLLYSENEIRSCEIYGLHND